MPELPEVEVVKKTLESQIKNLSIKSIKIIDKNLRYKVKKQSLKKILGFKVIKIKRRSKYLLFLFNKNLVMIVHLGMTGKFFFIKNGRAKRRTSFYYDTNKYNEKHNRIIFIFNKNMRLIYNDIRKFGFIKILKKFELEENFHLKNLGPEPLEDKFNYIYFKNYLVNRNRTIKNILMDQKFVSGLGNIYVCEALFRAGISPKRQALRISYKKLSSLVPIIKEILLEAISSGGSSLRDFRNASGDLGYFQHSFDVYGREDQDCYNTECDGKIKRITQAGRSSFYCSNCQR